MRKSQALSILCGALAAAALTPAIAAAAEPAASYIAVHAGRNNLDHWPGDVNFGGPTVSGQLNLDSGAHLGIIAGRQYGANRFEVEYQRGRFKLTGATLGSVSGAVSGSGHYDVLTVGAYRRADFSQAVAGFAGVGVGAASVSLPQASFTGCNCFAAARSSGWVLQARVGLEFALASGHSVMAHYTWINLPGPHAGGTPSVDYDRHQVGVLSVGYKKTF